MSSFTPEAEPDARLIAAAPRLYAACKAALCGVAIQTVPTRDRHPQAIANAQDDLAALKAAIAQAEGKE